MTVLIDLHKIELRKALINCTYMIIVQKMVINNTHIDSKQSKYWTKYRLLLLCVNCKISNVIDKQTTENRMCLSMSSDFNHVSNFSSKKCVVHGNYSLEKKLKK